MNIGASGASGNLGKAIVRELQARNQGHGIVAISRTPETAPDGMERRLGDCDRPATLAEAHAGLDSVVFIPTGREPNALRDVLATFLQ